MRDLESSNAEDKYRVLRRHPIDQSECTKKQQRSQSIKIGIDDAIQTSFDSIWSQLDQSDSEFSGNLPDLNTEVFEQLKAFCQESEEVEDDRIPVGALFTGALVQCQEIQPLELLIEVLKVSSFAVRLIQTASTLDTNICSFLERSFGGIECRKCVLVVDCLEALDPVWFEDLLSVLLRNRSLFRVTLLMGLSTTTRIDTLIPSSFRSRIRSRPFALMTPRQCFERTLERTLLSPLCPGLIVGTNVFEVLHNQFLCFHFTVKSFKDCLRIALLDHLVSDSLAPLLQFLNPGFCSNRVTLMKALKDWRVIDGREEEVARSLLEALERISGWKATLLCVHFLVDGLGLITRGSGYTLLELYLSSLESHFPKSPPKLKEWCEKRNDVIESSRRMKAVVQRMETVLGSFASSNKELKQLSKKLQDLSSRLDTTLSKDKDCVLIIGQEVDEILKRLIEDYCTTSPESLQGASIFCLKNEELLKRRIFAAPRLEIPDLLMDEKQQQNALDKGHLLKDSALLYELYLETTSNGNNIFDCFVEFAAKFGFQIPLKNENQDLEKDAEVREIRVRFECAVRALEELGLAKRVRRGDDQTVRVELFNN